MTKRCYCTSPRGDTLNHPKDSSKSSKHSLKAHYSKIPGLISSTTTIEKPPTRKSCMSIPKNTSSISKTSGPKPHIAKTWPFLILTSVNIVRAQQGSQQEVCSSLSIKLCKGSGKTDTLSSDPQVITQAIETQSTGSAYSTTLRSEPNTSKKYTVSKKSLYSISTFTTVTVPRQSSTKIQTCYSFPSIGMTTATTIPQAMGIACTTAAKESARAQS